MNRSRLLFFLLSIALLVPIVSATLVGAVSDRDDDGDSLYKHLSVFSEVLSLIRRAYVEPTEMETLFAGALDGTTDALDALSTYVPAEAAPRFREALEIRGGRSGLAIAKERGFAFVLAAEQGGPGAAAGLQTGDLLASLDEISTREMPLWRIQSLFAGEPGTEIAIEYLRRGRSVETTVTLEEFERPGATLEEVEDVPILRVPRIDAAAVERVRGLLDELSRSGRSRLIVDLRGSAGGEPPVAYRLADLFTAPGKLGELRSTGETLATFEDRAEPVWSGRLVVLTDRGTQGASEILTSVLRQSAGAELVGRSTFGHAGRQVLLDLSTGAQVYLTDAFYTGPDGESLDRGIEPTVAVTEAARAFADADVPLTDLILQRALEVVRVDPEAEAAA